MFRAANRLILGRGVAVFSDMVCATPIVTNCALHFGSANAHRGERYPKDYFLSCFAIVVNPQQSKPLSD